MATDVPTADTPAGPARSADLVLARLHLRLGSLALARAELETLAGRDALDLDGVVDLAEARWRTGDVAGAGEAAALVIEDDRGPLIALVIAAEAAMAIGRPTEARRYAARAIDEAGSSLDAVFAGMPRSTVWPVDPLVPPPEAMPLFEASVATTTAAAGRVVTAPSTSTTTPAPAAAPAAAAATIGLWEHGGSEVDVPAASASALEVAIVTPPDVEPDLPPAAEALEAGRRALAAGDRAAAAVPLGLAIRLGPHLAPAVLELVDADRGPELALVRGDAYRLVGREADARRAYADATPAAIASPEPAPADAPGTDDAAWSADHPDPDPPDPDHHPEGDPA